MENPGNTLEKGYNEYLEECENPLDYVSWLGQKADESIKRIRELGRQLC